MAPSPRPASESKSKSSSSTESATVTVDEYMAPRVPLEASIFAAVLFVFYLFALVQRGWFGDDKGGEAATQLLRRFSPGGLAVFRRVVRFSFWAMAIIHPIEAWWFDRTRLQKFGVRRGGRLWWLWIGSSLVEGGSPMKRFDIVVERLRGTGKRE